MFPYEMWIWHAAAEIWEHNNSISSKSIELYEMKAMAFIYLVLAPYFWDIYLISTDIAYAKVV